MKLEVGGQRSERHRCVVALRCGGVGEERKEGTENAVLVIQKLRGEKNREGCGCGGMLVERVLKRTEVRLVQYLCMVGTMLWKM